jgi:hypothetical protein
MLEREILGEERVRMLQSWTHSGFHVDTSRRLAAEDRPGLEQVLVYMERAPVALERLEYRRDARLGLLPLLPALAPLPLAVGLLREKPPREGQRGPGEERAPQELATVVG